MPPEEIEENRDKNVRRVIQNKGGSLIGLAPMRGEHGRRERNDDNAEQEQQIQNEEHVIGTGDMCEKAVMIDPHNSNKGETDEEREVSGPLPQQIPRQLAASRRRNLDLEN